MNLIADSVCAGCGVELPQKSSLFGSTKHRTCFLCSKQFCAACSTTIDFSYPGGTHSVTLCTKTCDRHMKHLQLDVYPWYLCAGSSRELFELESKLADAHTHACSRLANFEGLARFFSETADRVPRADILNTMPDLEEGVKRGINALTQIIHSIQKVSCTSRDETVKKALSSYASLLLSKVKTQFHLASKMYERLLHTRAKSPKPASVDW
jgi:hypothetical protein